MFSVRTDLLKSGETSLAPAILRSLYTATIYNLLVNYDETTTIIFYKSYYYVVIR